MALPNTNINVIGAINRPPINTDGILGLPVYNNNIADLTTFTATNNILKFSSLSSVEKTGITSSSTNFKDEYNVIAEFFAYGGSEVWIGIFPVPATTYDFEEIYEMDLKSKGEIKHYAINLKGVAFNVAHIAAIDAIGAQLQTDKSPAYFLYTANIGTLELSELPDLRNLANSNPYVSAVIGQDLLNYPATVTTYSVASIGAIAGTISQASVNENILNMGKYNYSNGSRNNRIGLRLNNGTTDNTLFEMDQFTKEELDELNDKGYIFFRYEKNYSGCFLSNDNNCAAIDDTFNSIHIVRQKNKAFREIDAALKPLVGSDLLFNTDGSLREASASIFVNAASAPLILMVQNRELSNYDVFVDPTQKALETKKVIVDVQIQPIESADYITVNLSFVASI